MNAVRFFRAIFFAGLVAATAPIFGDSGTLVIEMSGFKSNKGSAMLVVYDSKDTFSKIELARARAKVTISSGTARVEIENLPPGTYSVSVYHDENDNGKLDTNFLGMPKETYGFSNDARGKAGPPEWEATTFAFAGEKQTITIRLK